MNIKRTGRVVEASFESYEFPQAALLDTPPLAWQGLAKADIAEVPILFWQPYRCSVGRARWKGYTQSRVVGGGKRDRMGGLGG